jgi:hypothetical protein
VHADLLAKRDQIQKAIDGVEALLGIAPTSGSAARAADNSGIDNGPGALLGMSIVDAAKKLLNQHRKPLRNPELADMFKAGGLVLTSEEPANTIGSVLTRRFAQVGDVVKVARGTWGLKEWYPGRSFKKDKADDKEEAAAEATK